jgi:hypothetical protein
MIEELLIPAASLGVEYIEVVDGIRRWGGNFRMFLKAAIDPGGGGFLRPNME